MLYKKPLKIPIATAPESMPPATIVYPKFVPPVVVLYNSIELSVPLVLPNA